MAFDFSNIRYSRNTIKEYQDQILYGTFIRFKAYDGKTVDLHEHILRDIDSFRNLFDREIRERETSFEKDCSGLANKQKYMAYMKRPITIEFKNYNIEILQVD